MPAEEVMWLLLAFSYLYAKSWPVSRIASPSLAHHVRIGHGKVDDGQAFVKHDRAAGGGVERPLR